MRTFFSPSWVRLSLLAIVTVIGVPVVQATAVRSDSPGIRQAPVSAYIRPSLVMAQFGASGTVLSAQDLSVPPMAQVEPPLFSGASSGAGPYITFGTGLQSVTAAPSQSVPQNSTSSRLPQSSPWASLVATMMLIAFFLFRRTQ